MTARRSHRLVPLLLASLLAAATMLAQDAPLPTAWTFAARPLAEVAGRTLPALDLDWLAIDDSFRDGEDLPPRYAVPVKLDVTPDNGGTWEWADAETLIWRYRIRAPDAYSLNLGFTRYRMPPGGQLLLYSPDARELRGPFTDADNETHGELWSPVLLTDDLVVEVTIPAARRGELELRLGQAGHGYRGFGAPGEKSGACNMDIECLDGADPWRQTAKASAVISTGGSTFCSGSLLNTTANDRRPTFATANHCGINPGNAASLVTYWNYQNSTCRTPGSGQSGGPGDGSLAQFNTGSLFRAAWSPSDFTLVELDDPIQPAFDLYWAGWDRTPYQAPGGQGNGDHACTPTPDPTDPPSAGLCAGIHHPNTDEKRITFVETTTATTSYGGTTPPGDGTHVWAHWDDDPPYFPSPPGVTEPGSSGSPLYNSEHRYIGQLHGGPSACGATGDNLSDYYGRISVSWSGGGTPATRASDWLDPLGTAPLTLDGRGECEAPAAPVNLTATASAPNRIDLAWDAVPGAEVYRVFRALGACPASGWALLADDLATASYSDFEVSGGTTYAYRVTAVDTGQPCESAPSACADETATGECTLAPAFAGLATAASAGTSACAIELGWPAATPSCGGALAYNVYRSATGGFVPDETTRLARCVTGTTWTDTSTPAGVPLYYVVRAEEAGAAGSCPDGVEDANLVERSAVAGGPDQVLFQDDVEAGTGDWTPEGTGTGAQFAIVTSDSHSPTHSWFVPDPNAVNDKRLVKSTPLALPAFPARMRFWHRMESEDTYDGGVLEVSTDGGTTWDDVGAAAFLTGGYTGTISTCCSNPLGGRAAWERNVGAQGSFVLVEADLGAFAGESVRFRFRYGTDSSVADVGWWLDDVEVFAPTECVDTLIFVDGFESGDDLRWSFAMR